VLCLLALAYGALQLAQLYGLEEQISVDRQRAKATAEQYQRVTKAFPSLPTTTNNLRVTMQKYAELTRQTAPPDRLIGEISRALDASPKIEVDRIRWELSANPKDRIRDVEATRPRAAPAPQPSAAAPSKDLYEVAEVTGKVTAVRSSDYRTINLTVNEFLDHVRKRPGVEVIQAKMPFEVGPQSPLSGDIGTDDAGKTPQFTVTLARKLGP
jgi:hypothetical protein